MNVKMNIMDLQARKYEFIRELFKVDKASVMDKLEKILKKEQVDRDTIEEYNKDIDEAIDEIERGEFYTHEEARKIANKW
jgi:predicted transcriptional regulator